MLRTAIVSAVLLIATQAVGAPGQADVEKEVKRLFDEGQTAAASEDWGKAKASFGKAWDLLQLPQIARHLGRAEIRSGDVITGIEHLQVFLNARDGVAQAEIDAVQELLKEAKSKVTTVTLLVEQPDTDVLVDGQVIQEKPHAGPFYLLPGTHTFEARKSGYTGTTQRLDLSPGAKVGVFLQAGTRANLAVARPKREENVQSRSTGVAIDWVIAGVLGAGGIGGLTGASIAAYRVEEKNQLDGCADSNCTRRYNDDVNLVRNVAWTSVGLSLGATGAMISALVNGRKKPSASSQTSFWVVPTVGGVRVQGTW